MPFFNTIPLFAEELQEAEKQTLHQDDMVLGCFEGLKIPLSPSLVYKYLLNRRLISRKVPLTSIRRSITTLTKEGKISKTGNMVMGDYGKPENQWRINN